MKWWKAIFIEFFMELLLVCYVCNPYMVYVVCVCWWNACVYSVNWVGVLCNVGLGFFVEWDGGREKGV